jgi:hypothetical protein
MGEGHTFFHSSLGRVRYFVTYKKIRLAFFFVFWLGFKVGEGHDILHAILGRVTFSPHVAREGHPFSRGLTTILVALPPFNNDNSLKALVFVCYTE